MRRSRRVARLAAALIAVLCASGAARPCGAQTVSATSGDPAVIARIRTEFAAIEREAPAYRQTRHEVWNFSLEGGELTGFYRGRELRKLYARLFGETWQGTEEYYFSGDDLIFIHTVQERYDEPFSGRVRWTIEHRFYFDGGRLIRRIRTVRPAFGTGVDLSAYDPDLSPLLRNAGLFAACAAAPASDAPQCTAPEP
ncbi:MAG TPA: hypothetical protein VEQ60_11105 [Longimicrobium sp.]|nr:hypothetical protein [Longimicrobium sp.]